jgi:hypothetical protein
VFHIGQKVVCVDAKGTKNLTKGAVYTINSFDSGPGLWRGQLMEFGILLNEAKPNPGDVAFAPVRFRPVVERRTDISVFTAMLNDAKRMQPA